MLNEHLLYTYAYNAYNVHKSNSFCEDFFSMPVPVSYARTKYGSTNKFGNVSTFNCQWEFINCVKFLNNFFQWTLQTKMCGTTNINPYFTHLFLSVQGRARTPKPDRQRQTYARKLVFSSNFLQPPPQVTFPFLPCFAARQCALF